MSAISTPIAAQLAAHFARGGSIPDGISLVESLESASHELVTLAKRKAPSGRGSRLQADWRPSEGDIQYAMNRGMSEGRIRDEAEKFFNYWTAKAGAGATKRDWPATWRNWILTAMERGSGPASYRGAGPGPNFTPGRASTGSDAILAGMGRLADRVGQRRMPAVAERRPIPNDPNASFEFDVEPSRTR